MTTDDNIRYEKLQHNTLALLSETINKYEYLTGEEILSSDQSRIIEQARFTYFSHEKVFEKQIKTIEDQGIKQVEVLKVLKPEETEELKSIEELFPDEMMKLKMKYTKLKNWKIKLNKQT